VSAHCTLLRVLGLESPCGERFMSEGKTGDVRSSEEVVVFK